MAAQQYKIHMKDGETPLCESRGPQVYGVSLMTTNKHEVTCLLCIRAMYADRLKHSGLDDE